MYIEDPVDKEWTPHFFVLNDNKLFYTSHYKLDGDSSEKWAHFVELKQIAGIFEYFRDEEEDEGNSFVRPSRSIPNEELHFSEKWFHGKLARGREEAEDLLKMYSHLGKPFLFKFSG